MKLKHERNSEKAQRVIPTDAYMDVGGRVESGTEIEVGTW